MLLLLFVAALILRCSEAACLLEFDPNQITTTIGKNGWEINRYPDIEYTMGHDASFDITVTAQGDPADNCEIEENPRIWVKKTEKEDQALFTDKITISKSAANKYSLELKYTENRWDEEKEPVNLAIRIRDEPTRLTLRRV